MIDTKRLGSGSNANKAILCVREREVVHVCEKESGVNARVYRGGPGNAVLNVKSRI